MRHNEGPLREVTGAGREAEIVTAELAERQIGPGAGRERLRATALELFTERGVSATSLQMIADAMGVTKAAVYHHYKSKDEIVLAVVRPALEQLMGLVRLAESRRSRAAQVETMIVGLADLIIANRRLYALLQGDPTCTAILQRYPEFPTLGERLVALLAGPDPDPGSVVAAGMLLAGLRGAGSDPRVMVLDDEEFRRYVVGCAHRLMRPRRPASATG
ncbi:MULTISPECIES: TetR/AcrR family transcriptional regulator [unclassified Parafrankia]|uniref:TetR/AcrR family transcriptional regulator n=1 Tax=Parafrankia TaxID=2994362 RepID=UPI000DA47DA9|nr:TetR family transcriptional regulator [Parafrankia sp. BMG5.11]CAI7973460.1 Transcriptional regulator, TetR family [Frankia sp. Hr75.2]SQD98285.1 Transcriptional regulator, TetR family [Parafrankia sp. Ea1.12]